jgi:hypothetical protein
VGKSNTRVKNKIILFLLPLLLLGCSKKESLAENQATANPAPGLPFQITGVETPDAKERKTICNLAINYLDAKDYVKLEALAAQYRSSKEHYANGAWKLRSVYDAFQLPEGATEADYQARQSQLDDWVGARSDSLTARVALAQFLKDYAWHARGSDFANTISDQSWQIFFARLNQATKVLDSAANLNEKCPIYWSIKMWVALGSQMSKEQFNDVFKEATQAEPDYEGYYALKAVFFLPRWNGTEGEWEKDLADAADRKGGDDGDMLYARVVLFIQNYCSRNVFTENPQISWARMDRGFGVIEKRFPDSLFIKDERVYLAALACDKDKVRTYFIETQGKVDVSQPHLLDEVASAAHWAYGQ